jgi:hypothetical protein
MVLQILCVPSPTEKKATPKGVMAQWRAYSGSSDIQNTVLLTSQCRYQFPATKHSFYDMLKPFYSRRNEITLYQGCLLWGISVIVPVKLRTQILNPLH